MPNVNDLKNSRYLTKHDVEPAITVTIKSYSQENLAKDSGEPDINWILHFEETKPMVLKPTNGDLISLVMEDVYGVTQMQGDFDTWIGKKITLWNDKTVSFAGKRTGGIRVKTTVDEDIPF